MVNDKYIKTRIPYAHNEKLYEEKEIIIIQSINHTIRDKIEQNPGNHNSSDEKR